MKNNEEVKSKEIVIEQLKSKISQMEVMKKQYLRAYSKMKEEK